MAFLLLVCYLKTGEHLVFPIIGTLRAVALGFVFPANMAHLGTGLAGILAGVVAAGIVKNAARVRQATWLPLLGGIYAGSYAAGNYLTTLLFGPAAQTRIVLLSPHWAIGVIAGSLGLGLLLGLGACRMIGFSPPKDLVLPSRSHGAA